MTVDHCVSCNKPIIWATSKNGKPMPIDADPVQIGGNISLHPSPSGSKVFAQVWSQAQARDHTGDLYVSHFVTCPDAALHRRSR